MAPCELERRETVGEISISVYRVWKQFGGGYDIVARNGTELERVHAKNQRQADETFAMMVGKYGQPTADEAEFMAQWQEARRDTIDLRAWASGR